MHIFKKIWTSYWPVCILALLSFGLIVANIRVDGSWFLGWDSTTPEINLGLNFSRFLSGVWQEYRGLGTTDGMAHTSLIVHWIYSALLSLILPRELIRPILNILTMFVASWGTFILTHFVLSNRQTRKLSLEQNNRITWVSFISAMFVQFNLLTIQMYNMPLELFSFHFAVLPWTLWALSKQMLAPTKKTLLVVALITLAGASQAHVPTVFVSYLLFVGVWALGLLWGKSWKQKLKSGSLAVLVILLINGFWLLPYSYAVVTKSSEISQAKQNIIGTPSVFYRNSVWGTAGSLLTFGGFQLDYNDWNSETNQFELVMSVWKEYWQSPQFKVGASVLSAIILLGLFSSLVKKPKRWLGLELGPILGWLLCFVMLGTSIPVIGEVSGLLREHVPLFAQIFRFTFTKFSLGYVIFSGLLLAFGIEFLLAQLAKSKIRATINWGVLFSSLLGVILMLSLPIWGNLYYQRLFVQVPDSYFDFSTYLNTQHPNARYATFPMHSLWGWTTNTTEWGYRGSGFLWQLATQPMVDRAFDPWSKYNETIYLQLSQALYRQEATNFYELAAKYHLTHLLDDLSVFHPGNYPQALFREEMPLFIDEISNLTKEQQFDNLDLYSFKFPDNRSTEVFAPANLQMISPAYISAYTTRDVAYAQGGDYIQKSPGIEYPLSFLQQNDISHYPPSMEVRDNSLVFTLPKADANRHLTIPNFSQLVPILPVSISLDTNYSASHSALSVLPRLPTIVVDQQPLSTPNPITKEIAKSSSIFVLINDRLIGLTKKSPPQVLAITTNQANIITIYDNRPTTLEELSLSSDSTNCALLTSHFSTPLPQNLQCQSALVKIKGADSDADLPSPGKVLVNLTLHTSSKAQTAPEICIEAQSNKGSCINDPIHWTTTPQSEKSTGVVILPLQPDEEYRIYFLTSYVQGDYPKQVAYESVVLQQYPMLSTEQLDLGETLATFEASLQSALAETSTSVSLIFSIHDDFSVVPRWANGKQTSTNCAKQGEGTAEKIIQQTKTSIRSTEKGIFCDEIPLPDLLADVEYLYSTRGEQISGAGTKIYLTNPFTKHLDLESITSPGNFSLLIPVIPSRNSYHEQVGTAMMSYTAESFGADVNATDFWQQELTPLPIGWLSAIKDEPKGLARIQNLTTILNSQKIGTFLYLADVKIDSTSGVVTLPQSFDPGWIAFPGWRMWHQFEHVTYNGWANGWIVPSSGSEALAAGATARVTILYWPQLLSYLGYVVLLGTLAWLGVSAWKERKPLLSPAGEDHLMDAELPGVAIEDVMANPRHFSPTAIEKLFIGRTLSKTMSHEWTLFQKEVAANTHLIAQDFRSTWSKLHTAVKELLKGQKK